MVSHPADVLLPRLASVREAGANRWMACCPAHDDKTPSLSIRETDDRLLIHCFAGCPSDDVLAAIGLTYRDLYEQTAANEAAFVQAAKRIREPVVAPLEHERLILSIARNNINQGRPLSIEDQARVELALERVKAGGD